MASTNPSAARSPRSTRSIGYAIAGLLTILLGTATRAVLVKSGKAAVTSGTAVVASPAAPALATTNAPVASSVIATPTSELASAPVHAKSKPNSYASSAKAPSVAAPSVAAASATPVANAVSSAASLVADAAVAPVSAATPATPDVRAVGGIGAGRPATSAVDWRAITALPGVHFNATEITDASSGTSSMAGAHALRTHSNLELRVNLDSLLGWSGLTLYVQHKTRTGRNGSGGASFVQAFSNIDAEDFRRFGEVYAQQAVFNDRLRVKVGRLDFNTEFAGTPHGASFLNAAMGFTPAITAAPTFPSPVGAFNVIASPTAGWQLSAGMFDGTTAAPSAIGDAARFQIAQSAHEWAFGSNALDGKVTLGAWRHTGLFTRLTDDPESDPHTQGTHGWYGTLDQTVWRGAKRADDVAGANIGAFLQVGRSDPNVAAVNSHHGGGLTFSGLWAKRASDVLGAAATKAQWSGGSESISELFYQAPIVSHLSIVADWQHVARRDLGVASANGHVFTLRTILAF